MDQLLEREFEIARRIQASFLPEDIPEFPGWKIAARFRPARQVSGDFYDVFPLVQNRRLGLVIGDVCDKGVGAAIFMALFRTLIRAFAQQHYVLRWMGTLNGENQIQMLGGERPAPPSTGTSALKNAIELTNDYIANNHGNTSMFATLFFGVLDPVDGMLQFVNGGHEFPLLVNSSGVNQRLEPTGPLVGIFPGAHFDIRAVCIEPGETLLAFTDGVTEALDSDGEFYGRERLYKLLEQPFSTPDEMLDRVQASLQEFRSGADPSDDVALLAIQRE